MNNPVRNITNSIGRLNPRFIRYSISALGIAGSVVLVKKLVGTFAAGGKMSTGSVRDLLATETTSSDIVLIDLRTAEKFSEDHMERAFNVEYSSPYFREMVSKFDRGKTYLVYSDDIGMNAKAARCMHSLGFKCVYYPDTDYSGLRSEL